MQFAFPVLFPHPPPKKNAFNQDSFKETVTSQVFPASQKSRNVSFKEKFQTFSEIPNLLTDVTRETELLFWWLTYKKYIQSNKQQEPLAKQPILADIFFQIGLSKGLKIKARFFLKIARGY